MILINLLPHREEKRQLRKQAFFAGLGASVAIGAVVVGLWYGFQQQMISGQQARNDFLAEANRKLDAEIKDVSSLKAEIESLRPASALWKIFRPIATCRSTCSTNWSSRRPRAST